MCDVFVACLSTQLQLMSAGTTYLSSRVMPVHGPNSVARSNALKTRSSSLISTSQPTKTHKISNLSMCCSPEAGNTYFSSDHRMWGPIHALTVGHCSLAMCPEQLRLLTFARTPLSACRLWLCLPEVVGDFGHGPGARKSIAVEVLHLMQFHKVKVR